jgi:hypothetical protein
MITIRQERSSQQADWEAREAVEAAIASVQGKNGCHAQGRNDWDVELFIGWGHNIYTTNIYLVNKKTGLCDAYFADGLFRDYISDQPIKLL